MAEIRIAAKLHSALLAEAAGAGRHECCGLLLGDPAGGITAIAPAANLAADPARHFAIDPAALIAAHRAARAGGPQVLGYYHSHPGGPASPSPTDRAEAWRDGMVWAIIGPARAGAQSSGEIGWFRDGKRGFEPLCTTVADG